jgi:ribosomal protein S18 acetylase RimI-like enzyme
MTDSSSQGPAAKAPTIRRAITTDRRELADTLARAFDDDPVWSWLFPDPASRERRSAQVFHAYLRDALNVGEVYTTPDRSGASLWKPPGRWKLSNGAIVRLPASLEVERKVESQHPTEPHWYLAVVGTDPVAQGKGIGGSLIRQITDRCDAEGLPAYLESSKEANVPYYERFGFKVTGDIQLGTDGPTIWFMWRDPQVPDA